MQAATWGDFEVYLDRIVGRGGTSTVYEARQVSLDRPCVVKVLDAQLREPEMREDLLVRFRNEAKLVARIRDPRIIQVFQAGENEGRMWIAMERAEGGTLESVIQSGALMPEAEVIRVGREVALGLRSAYQQEKMIHRDIKPGNIFLTRNRDVRIADFGLAKILTQPSAKLTDTGTVMGTPSYLAPEVIRGEDADHRADIYALGCMLYEMLVQLPPFDGESFVDLMYKHVNEIPPEPKELRPEISEHLNAVVMRCLQKKREDRYPDYDEMIRALEPPAPPAAPPRRIPLMRVLLPAVLVVAAGAAALALWPKTKTPEPTVVVKEPPPIPKPKPEEPKPPPPSARDDRPEQLRALVDRREYEKARDLAVALRKELPDLALQVHAVLGEWNEVEKDSARMNTVVRLVRAIRETAHVSTLAELEGLVGRIDELQKWAEHEDLEAWGRAAALSASAEGLDRLGSEIEAKAIRERASKIFPQVKQITVLQVLDAAGLAAAANKAASEGDLGPAQKLRRIAQQFSLSAVIAELKGLDRELHASELLETGNDADVLQNCAGTCAFKDLTARILADFRKQQLKDWLGVPEAWKKIGVDLSKSEYEMKDGTLVIQSPVGAFGQCAAPNAERGYSIEFQAELEDRGWACVVLQPDPKVLLSFSDGQFEITSGNHVNARGKASGIITVEALSYKDHYLVYVQGEPACVFAPGDVVVESVVRVGVCKGKLTLRKAAVLE
jgi:serine/threonine protein kinase